VVFQGTEFCSSKNTQVAAMAPFSPENIDDIMAQEKALSIAQMLATFQLYNYTTNVSPLKTILLVFIISC
jgi:hypothetical protein